MSSTDNITSKNNIPENIKKLLKFEESVATLKQKIKTEIISLKQIKSELKKIENNYQQDLLKVWKSKKKRINNGEKTGFIKNKKLPKKLADLIGVPEGTEMSMPEYTRKFYENVLVKKGLLYEGDKRILRADKELMEILNLPASVNNSINHKDKNGFNFSTLQRYLSKIMNEENNCVDKQVEIKHKIVNKNKNNNREKNISN